MLLVDSRAGSHDLVAPLRKAGLPVEETVLPFGDIAFAGRGAGGEPLAVGLEHKKIPDLVDSLMSDRLAGHQLPGTVQLYDRHYLILEGEWDHDIEGRVIVPRKGFKNQWQPLKGAPFAAVLEQRVINLATRGGLTVRWTRNQKETVRYVSALFRYWCDRDLDAHKSHLAIHAPDLDRALLVPVSDERRVYAAFPSLSYARSAAVDAHFSSIWSAVNAEEAEWQKVEGIGKKLATQIVRFLRGRKGE